MIIGGEEATDSMLGDSDQFPKEFRGDFTWRLPPAAEFKSGEWIRWEGGRVGDRLILICTEIAV